MLIQLNCSLYTPHHHPYMQADRLGGLHTFDAATRLGDLHTEALSLQVMSSMPATTQSPNRPYRPTIQLPIQILS